MGDVEVLAKLKEILAKYESTGIRIWGKAGADEFVEVKVTSDGKLVWSSG